MWNSAHSAERKWSNDSKRHHYLPLPVPEYYKKAAELEEIDSCEPIWDTTRFTDPAQCKKITVPQIDLQHKWHRLREVETDKKIEIPSTSKLKKAEKAEVLVGAIRRWMSRVEAGEVQLMGKGNTEAPEEQNETIESDDEEDEVGYGDQN
ncbi:hypothetical protein R3P38DRAFT_3210636 [Favolaschia claudopus]|uniref:Uncharacterized protein n=1 Tax=Favolaschia claudopus TaxID=2862362 RepID=A0AAW0AGN5_9AGAR